MLVSVLLLLLAGLAGGFIAGLAGIGGGIVYIFIIPIALNFFGVPLDDIPQFTIANSIFAIFFASVAGNYVRFRNKEIFLREILIIGGVGSLISVLVLEYVVNSPWYSLPVFNMVLLVLLLYLLVSTLAGAKKNYDNPPASVNILSLGGVGFAGGSISALSGLGGGVIIIPLLNIFYKINIKKAGTISLGVITVMTFFMTIFNLFKVPASGFSYYNQGYILFPVALPLLIGAIVGSPIGSKVAQKIKSSLVSYIYSGFLIIVIIRKVFEIVEIYI